RKTCGRRGRFDDPSEDFVSARAEQIAKRDHAVAQFIEWPAEQSTRARQRQLDDHAFLCTVCFGDDIAVARARVKYGRMREAVKLSGSVLDAQLGAEIEYQHSAAIGQFPLAAQAAALHGVRRGAAHEWRQLCRWRERIHAPAVRFMPVVNRANSV